VDSEGRKFGKSVGGAIWLSAAKLSPYKFYQYLFQARLTFYERPEQSCNSECVVPVPGQGPCRPQPRRPLQRRTPPGPHVHGACARTSLPALVAGAALPCCGPFPRHAAVPTEIPTRDLQVTDADVFKLLRMLTFLPLDEIAALEAAAAATDGSYAPNTAQRRLAEEV
jgi:hypothetical protein